MRAIISATIPRTQYFTANDASERCGCEQIWRIESGQTSMRSHDVRTMCGIYGASEEMTQALVGLARETKAPAGGIHTVTRCRSGSSCTSVWRVRPAGRGSTNRS